MEKGATPQVRPLRRRVLDATRAFTTPLLPDDYIALINPMWSTRELKGEVVRVHVHAGVLERLCDAGRS